MLTIKISGGLGFSYKGQIDIDKLPSHIRDKVKLLLAAPHLTEVAGRDVNTKMADAIHYEIEWPMQKGISFTESQAEGALLDLIDELKPHLTILKAGGP